MPTYETNETPAQQAAEGGQQPPAPEAPATEVDWKAKARDWEARSKQNHKDLQAAQQQLEEVQAQVSALTETNESLSLQVHEFETERDRQILAREVAEEVGVQVEVLRGSTREELVAHANQIKAFSDALQRPVVPRQADTPGTQPADPNIEAVRNLFG